MNCYQSYWGMRLLTILLVFVLDEFLLHSNIAFLNQVFLLHHLCIITFWHSTDVWQEIFSSHANVVWRRKVFYKLKSALYTQLTANLKFYITPFHDKQILNHVIKMCNRQDVHLMTFCCNDVLLYAKRQTLCFIRFIFVFLWYLRASESSTQDLPSSVRRDPPLHWHLRVLLLQMV